MRNKFKNIKFALVIMLTTISVWFIADYAVYASAEISTPILKWQHGGCYSSWCETGWYSSPAVADLDGDGTAEIIGATYSIFVLNGIDGSLKWSKDPDGSRVWPGVVIADLEGDGDLEIITAHGGGYINVFDHTGNIVWSQHAATNEFRSLAVADLDGDGDMEIVVGQAKLDKVNVWVFEHTGTLRSGWPQLSNDEGSAAGFYNDNLGIGDLDSDGELEIIAPSDTITICAYNPDGTHLATHSMYHGHSGHDMDYWGEVPAYVNLEYETRGWGPCYTESTFRANFANGPANIVDVDSDGTNEVVVIGDVHNCHTSPYTDIYNGPYIFNADRSRFSTGSFSWETLPTNTGAPIVQDYNIIESVQPNPVTVDLDGDGQLEILYPSYDGKMHAFWLDKTEHHNWPYSVYDSSEGVYRFASEPVVADLDNNGSPEIIFSSWVEKESNLTGSLFILNYQGTLLQKVDLPLAYSGNWNGALAAPTLANIDADPDLEVVLNTAHSGFIAYDFPDTGNASIIWGTGRGSYGRIGSVLNNISDTAPPIRSNPSPTGILLQGTTGTTLSLTTNENATCRCSNVAGISYDSMTETFTTTGSTSHSTTVDGLSDGNSYTYCVRCRDMAGNANTDDFEISFSVATQGGGDPGDDGDGDSSGGGCFIQTAAESFEGLLEP